MARYIVSEEDLKRLHEEFSDEEAYQNCLRTEVPDGDFSIESGLVVTYERLGGTGYGWVSWQPERPENG